MAIFKVNWKLDGFRGKIHELGDEIEAEFEEVKELVAQGVLTILGDNATESESSVVPVDLTTLSNDQLVTYAKEKFNFDLDPSLERVAMLTELADLAENAPDVDGAGSDTDLNEMTKVQLITLAKDKYRVVLAPNLNKAAIVAEITALEAKVQK